MTYMNNFNFNVKQFLLWKNVVQNNTGKVVKRLYDNTYFLIYTFLSISLRNKVEHLLTFFLSVAHSIGSCEAISEN